MGQDQLFNNNTVVKKINDDYAAFFQMLTNKTGLKMSNGLQEMWKISDVLTCEVNILINLLYNQFSLHLNTVDEVSLSQILFLDYYRQSKNFGFG